MDSMLCGFICGSDLVPSISEETSVNQLSQHKKTPKLELYRQALRYVLDYLYLADIARLEVVSRWFHLRCIVFDPSGASNQYYNAHDDSITLYPYDGPHHVIHSSIQIQWLNNRRIKLTRIALFKFHTEPIAKQRKNRSILSLFSKPANSYIFPSNDSSEPTKVTQIDKILNKDKEWDMFNHVTHINLSRLRISQYDEISMILSKLHNIKSFQCDSNQSVLSDSDLETLIAQSTLNGSVHMTVKASKIMETSFPTSPVPALTDPVGVSDISLDASSRNNPNKPKYEWEEGDPYLQSKQLPSTWSQAFTPTRLSLYDISPKYLDIDTPMTHLETLNINIGYISPEAVTNLITKISSISTVFLNDNVGSYRPTMLGVEHMRLIISHWKYLSSFTVASPVLSDEGLELFRQASNRFHHIRLMHCPLVTFAGVSAMISNSSESLLRLRFDSINIREEELSLLLASTRNLVALAYDHRTHSLTDTLLLRLAESCPKIKSIKLTARTFVTDVGIEAICRHCPDLEILQLSPESTLSPASIRLIASTYKNTLKEICIAQNDLRNDTLFQGFKSCRHRVRVF